MSSAVAERVVNMRWKGPIATFLRDTTPEIDLEGALSSGKTTAVLWKVFNSLQEHPGIHWWIGRYGDGETQTKIRPAFEQVCQHAGCVPVWNAKELCYDFANGSKCFAYGLKSPDALSRYSKMRGMGVAGIYNDQTEELPEDFSLELRLRLRQKCDECEGCLSGESATCLRYPHQLIFSPNPPNVTHWLAQQFPTDNRLPNRKYYAISIHDNAHNLPKELLDAALMAYPVEHAKHRSVILGLRGMNVTGEPVYKGAFVRALHEVKDLRYDPALPLLVALDFGKHHPCMVAKQISPLGQNRFLGGVLGQNLYLDDFLDVAQGKLADWFPGAQVQWCCDPAGASDTSHGTQGAVKILRAKGIVPRYRPDSNSPAIRLAMVERMASQMRKRAADRSEACVINGDSEHWLTISEHATVPDRFLADAFEAGYVWDEHMVSVGNKQVRKPKKDGWYEHGMNCAEYLEVNFGYQERKPVQAAVKPYQPKGVWG